MKLLVSYPPVLKCVLPQVRILVDNKGAPYVFDINVPQYSVVKLAWIFLGTSLLTTIIMFPVFRFKPPL